jgi:hypothetical protein
LLTVDFDDRDHPEVVAETSLAWTADRVVVHEDFIVEIENGAGGLWGGSGEALSVVRVVDAAEPHVVLEVMALGDLPVSGITRRGGRLYVAQSGTYYPYPVRVELADDPEAEPPEPSPDFVLSILDLTRLPELQVLGDLALSTDDPGGGNWQAVWPREDLLVWVGGGSSYGWWGGPIPLEGGGTARFATDALWWPWRGGGGGRLLAFGVGEPADPVWVSEVDLRGDGTGWNYSEPFTANGMVYLSHQASVFMEGVELDGWTTTYDGRPGVWMTRHFLDVVDYSVPEDAVPRPPVNVPGRLHGLGRSGSLLYTVGFHYDEAGRSDWVEMLDVSAYDGVAAYLVDSLPLSLHWPRPVLVSDPCIYVGVPGALDPTTELSEPHRLQAWTVPDTGRFTPVAATELDVPASQLKAIHGMLAVRDTENGLVVFDGVGVPGFRQIGRGRPAGCTWYDLSHADANARTGVVLPLGIYGVQAIPVQP